MALENNEFFDFENAPRVELSYGRVVNVYPDGRESIVLKDGTELFRPTRMVAEAAVARAQERIDREFAQRRARLETLAPETYRPILINK